MARNCASYEYSHREGSIAQRMGYLIAHVSQLYILQAGPSGQVIANRLEGNSRAATFSYL